MTPHTLSALIEEVLPTPPIKDPDAITEEWLKEKEVCFDGLHFMKVHKLLDIPISVLNNVVGDFNNYKRWCISKLPIGNKLDHTNDFSDTYDSVNKTRTVIAVRGTTYVIKYNDDALKTIETIEINGRCRYTFEYKSDKTIVNKITGGLVDTTYVYSPQGKLLSSTDRDGNGVSNTYDEDGDITYDDLGRKIQRMVPGFKETWIYNDHGCISEYINSNGTRHTLEYDDNGFLRKESLSVRGEVPDLTAYFYDHYATGQLATIHADRNGVLEKILEVPYFGPVS